MRQVLPDLWETSADAPYPGVTTHAYLWTGPNLLFYSPAGDAELDRIAELGGVASQYLSHRDEAGPMLARIAERFGSLLHAPAAELAEIGRQAHVDVPLGSRHTDSNGVEVIPTPGHSPGSLCYFVDGAAGSYLFTGDTLLIDEDGAWIAGYVPGISDADALADSLRLLARLRPDVVISSGFLGRQAVHWIRAGDWSEHVAQAVNSLATGLANR